MIIKKGTQLTITHVRTGTWKAIATEEFDPESKVFWPVMLDEGWMIDKKATEAHQHAN